jgi:hypothetical protein
MAFKDVYQVFELAYRESNAREQSPERDSPALTPTDILVWLALAHHKHHKTGLCCPGYERLMKCTGLGRTALAESVQRLKSHWISVERSGRASRYRWEFPELPEASQLDSTGITELAEGEVREPNFSSSGGELQKIAKRTSEVRETASNQVFKKERETGLIDRLNPAELVSGDKTSSSLSSVEYPPPERLARLVLYSLLEHDKSDVNHQSPVYLRAVEDARPFLLTHDVEEAKRYLKLIKEDEKHWWFDFIKDADFPVAYFASAFPKIKKYYDSKAPVSKAQPKAKAAEKKETRDTTTNPFAKWQKKEEIGQ